MFHSRIWSKVMLNWSSMTPQVSPDLQNMLNWMARCRCAPVGLLHGVVRVASRGAARTCVRLCLPEVESVGCVHGTRGDRGARGRRAIDAVCEPQNDVRA